MPQLDYHFGSRQSNGIDVVFDGSLSLWRAAINLDILIVLHDDFHCLEIASFNPIACMESQRIFVDLPKLMTKLDYTMHNALLQAREDEFRRKKRRFSRASIEKEVTFECITKYLLSRLAVEKEDSYNSYSSAHYSVYLKPQLGDIITVQPLNGFVVGACPSGVMLDIVIPKPELLHHVGTSFSSSLMSTKTTEELLLKSVEALQSKKTDLPPSGYSSQSTIVDSYKRLMCRRVPLGDSIAKVRWQWAVNKILFHLACTRTRAMLERRERALLINRKSSRSNKENISIEQSTFKQLRSKFALSPLRTRTNNIANNQHSQSSPTNSSNSSISLLPSPSFLKSKFSFRFNIASSSTSSATKSSV